MILKNFFYEQNWNIGFCEETPEEIIQSKILKPIQWLKHPYKDRWFADPFILKVTEDDIVVFVEECPIVKPKGILCELTIDRKTKLLKERHVLLELDTHLSYPAIFHQNGKTYVYPENSASGKLYIYEYDPIEHKLINPICIIDEPVTDTTIVYNDGVFTAVATKVPKTQENVFLYRSTKLLGPYLLISTTPLQRKKSCSRPGGNWICLGEHLYRPAQNCEKRYGASLSIMHVDRKMTTESLFFDIYPSCFNYQLGLHTINFNNGICVIDGYGYLYPAFMRLYKYLYITFKRIKLFISK